MDIKSGESRFTTTLQMPVWLRQEIKSKGMTVHGALLTGWQAIKERQSTNQEIAELKASYQSLSRAHQKTLTELADLKYAVKDT